MLGRLFVNRLFGWFALYGRGRKEVFLEIFLHLCAIQCIFCRQKMQAAINDKVGATDAHLYRESNECYAENIVDAKFTNKDSK